MKTSLLIKFCIGTLLLLFLFSAGIFAQDSPWNKSPENPIISSTPWSSNLRHPAVLFENGLYKMWFGADDAGYYGSIGYAESENGLNWTIEPEPVISGTVGGNWQSFKGPGTVLRINDTLKMWYSGSSDGFNVELAIGYAYYDESIEEWIVHPDPVLDGDPGTWDAQGVVQPKVYYDGSTYHMWYHGFENTSYYAPCGIGYATSNDGINWTKFGDSAVFPTGPSGSFYSTWNIPNSVLYMMNQSGENEFRMWFSGWDGLMSPFNMRIGYATSPDGIDWTVQNENLCVLDVGAPGSWDSKEARMAGVMHYNDTLRMWYTGMETSGWSTAKIGYAWCHSPIAGEAETPFRPMVDIYPNPCSNFTNLTYSAEGAGQFEIGLYDITGRKIRKIAKKIMQADSYEKLLDLSDFNPGIYLIKIQFQDKVLTKKLIKQK